MKLKFPVRLLALSTLAILTEVAQAGPSFQCKPSGHGDYSLVLNDKAFELKAGSQKIALKKTAPMIVEGGVSVDFLKVYQTKVEKSKGDSALVAIRQETCSTDGEGPGSSFAYSWIAVIKNKAYEGCCSVTGLAQ